MKNLILPFLFLFLGNLTAQEDYFNKRYYFSENYLASQMSSIAATDSAYYATVVAFDTTLLYRVGSVFVKFDLEGNVLKMTPHIDSTIALQTWSPTLSLNENGEFITCGKYLVYDDDAINRAILIKINETGSYVQTKEYYSPNVEVSDFIAPLSLDICQDGGYIVTNNIVGDNGINTNVWVTKFDADFNLVWDVVINSDWTTSGRSIREDAAGNIVLGIYTNDYSNEHRSDLTSQARIIKFSSDGEILADFRTPDDEIWGPPYDITPLDDGSIVVAGIKGRERDFYLGDQLVGFLEFDHIMYKFNNEMELEWQSSFSNNEYFSGSSEGYYVKMMRMDDGTGFVAAGAALFIGDYMVGSFERASWLTKVSESGDSLWARHLYFMDSINYDNVIMDMALAPDGGFILSGKSARKLLPQDYVGSQQQGWLLKVDRYGCLVPDCQGDFVDETAAEESEPFRILLYPNPVQETLYIHFQTKQFHENNKFRISSLDGRVLRTFSSQSNEGTFILPVSNYLGGIYFIEYFEEGQLLQTQQFVKY